MGQKAMAGRLGHPVYAFYRTHVAFLLRQIAADDDVVRVEYLADALLAPLAPDQFLYQREARGMSLEAMTEGWQALADGVIVAATR